MARDNIVFIAEYSPFGYDYSGLSSFKTSHLELLLKTYTDSTIVVVVVEMWRGTTFDERSLDWLKEKYDNLGQVIISKSKLDNTLSIYQAYSLKRIARYHFPNIVGDLPLINEVVQLYNPKMIWAEHFYPAILCRFNGLKYYYSHHDFVYKLKLIRDKSLRSKIKGFTLRILEFDVLRKSAAVISGSKLEIDEISTIAAKSRSLFLPTTYELIPKNKLREATDFEIVHLGSTLATSNRIGLIDFLKEVIPVLNKSGIKYSFLIIGNIDNIYEEYKTLFEQDNVKIVGFVSDLKEVLSAYQIHVIPYNKVSGTRTRLTQALNYNQLLLSTYNGSSGFGNLITEENCILVEDLTKMKDEIIKLYHDFNRVKKISDKGRSMYEKNYSLDAQSELLKSFVNSLS